MQVPTMSSQTPGLRSGSISRVSSEQGQESTASTSRHTGSTRSAASFGPSSYSQRTPARSFFHQASHAAADTGEYSSQGVREETAQLASWALNDKNPLSDADSQASPGSAFRKLSSTSRGESVLPYRIEETTEPPTPEESHVSPSQHVSLLSNQLRGQETRPLRQSPDEMTPKATEATPLLGASQLALPTAALKIDEEDRQQEERQAQIQTSEQDIERQAKRRRNGFQQLIDHGRHETAKVVHMALHPKLWSAKSVWNHAIKKPVGLLPCVFLGLLLNVLDALSYGMILFPLGEDVFAGTGADGISIFYVSCIVAQLVYSCGGSIFKGAVGSEMIEVVPFFHKMALMILAKVGTDKPQVVLATTITSYALSSVLTGIVFLLLGCFKLGSLVSFFPRHILIGCIGGVGFFLVVTGLEVSARLGGVTYDWDTAKHIFSQDTVLLWVLPLLLSIFLLAVKHYRDAPWVVPTFFVSITAIFYIIVVAVPNLSLPLLREKGWIFREVPGDVPFYHFYSYFDFAAVDWAALASTIPAMFALTFFGILHVPINVPALAIAAEEDDLNLNRELVAHGLSNALSGCVGSIQNYLVYVNSEMFIHNGGNNRLAGILLAGATFGVLVAGPDMIGYVPIMVVGTLIFYLGIALLEEALVDTWGKMNRLEYLTVLAIVLIMGVYDFVAGIFAGIVLACLNFVVQTSRKSAIRATFSAEIVESTVRRHPLQRHFLREVGYQTVVTKLAGYLFFGSIVQVEKQSRALIDDEAFQRQAIRYLIFDLAHVNGIDYSAVEAFTRIERILGRRDVHMVVSGVDRESDVGKSLRSVGLWSDDSSVEFFETLNAALEFCENELLKAFYRQRDALRSHEGSVMSDSPQALSKQHTLTIPKTEAGPSQSGIFSASFNSPRQRFLKQAATTTLTQPTAQQSLHPPKRWDSFKQPLPLLLQAFHELTWQSEDFWHQALPFFKREHYADGAVLFRAGEESEQFYLVESGFLRATYNLPVGNYSELIVAGTTCGELPFFSNTKRTATLTVESPQLGSTCWVLWRGEWERMQRDWPEGAREMQAVALRLTKERVDAVTSYVLTTAG